MTNPRLFAIFVLILVVVMLLGCSDWSRISQGVGEQMQRQAKGNQS